MTIVLAKINGFHEVAGLSPYHSLFAGQSQMGIVAERRPNQWKIF